MTNPQCAGYNQHRGNGRTGGEAAGVPGEEGAGNGGITSGGKCLFWGALCLEVSVGPERGAPSRCEQIHHLLWQLAVAARETKEMIKYINRVELGIPPFHPCPEMPSVCNHKPRR